LTGHAGAEDVAIVDGAVAVRCSHARPAVARDDLHPLGRLQGQAHVDVEAPPQHGMAEAPPHDPAAVHRERATDPRGGPRAQLHVPVVDSVELLAGEALALPAVLQEEAGLVLEREVAVRTKPFLLHRPVVVPDAAEAEARVPLLEQLAVALKAE